MNDLTVIDNKQLEKTKDLLVKSKTNPNTRRAYKDALDHFFAWLKSEGMPVINKALVHDYRDSLIAEGKGTASINLRLTAIRRLASEGADNGILPIGIAIGIQNVEGIPQKGVRMGSWLTLKEAQALIRKPDVGQLKGLRDRAILSVLIGCGLRRSELTDLTFEHVQQREGRWVFVNIEGKSGRVRSVPMASWVKSAIDQWLEGAGIEDGHIFRPINRGGNLSGDSMHPQSVYDMVKHYAPDVQVHDLRRTFAKLAKQGSAELDQIQIVLGHASIQTTERYLGTELELTNSPSDHIKI